MGHGKETRLKALPVPAAASVEAGSSVMLEFGTHRTLGSLGSLFWAAVRMPAFCLWTAGSVPLHVARHHALVSNENNKGRLQPLAAQQAELEYQ